jgi:hypothetical protein
MTVITWVLRFALGLGIGCATLTLIGLAYDKWQKR